MEAFKFLKKKPTWFHNHRVWGGGWSGGLGRDDLRLRRDALVSCHHVQKTKFVFEKGMLLSRSSFTKNLNLSCFLFRMLSFIPSGFHRPPQTTTERMSLKVLTKRFWELYRLIRHGIMEKSRDKLIFILSYNFCLFLSALWCLWK